MDPLSRYTPFFNALNTEANRIPLARAFLRREALEILSRDDLDKLPESGQRLVADLQGLQVRRKERRQKRDEEIQRLQWERTMTNYATIGTFGLTAIYKVTPMFLKVSESFKSRSGAIPALLATGLNMYQDWLGRSEQANTWSLYADQRNRLDNDTIATLTALEPMLHELDTESGSASSGTISS